MDQHSFDRFTRAMAVGQSRRLFVRRMFGVGAALFAATRATERAEAAPEVSDGHFDSWARLQEPSELAPAAGPRQTVPQSEATICVEPLVDSGCGCLDPTTETCCRNKVCSGVCTTADGCCNVSTDTTVAARGEVCGDHCCHPHLDPAQSGYSECCAGSCCVGHCYGEDLCCAVDHFCPGTISDLCCNEGERCCGAGTAGNSCIPGGDGSCCAVDECAATADACYVSCDAGFCRQHICNDGAICCPDGLGGVGCVAGNCCGDADCSAGEVCQDGHCTVPPECLVDGDCTAGDACSAGVCQEGVCQYTPLCPGECAVCTDGICSTDETVCGLCGVCDAGTCSPVVCPDGYTCYAATGECLGIA